MGECALYDPVPLVVKQWPHGTISSIWSSVVGMRMNVTFTCATAPLSYWLEAEKSNVVQQRLGETWDSGIQPRLQHVEPLNRKSYSTCNRLIYNFSFFFLGPIDILIILLLVTLPFLKSDSLWGLQCLKIKVYIIKTACLDVVCSPKAYVLEVCSTSVVVLIRGTIEK